MARAFIIGGTLEARQVAEALHKRGVAVMSSLAGVTRSPHIPAGSVRIGGYGSDAGMADFIKAWGADILIDCAHPFAVNIKRRLAKLAGELGLPLFVFQRDKWQAGAGDDWHYVADLDEGLSVAGALGGDAGGRIFAALGRQQFQRLGSVRCEFLLLRQVPNGGEGLPRFASPCEVISAYPATDIGAEQAMLENYNIDVILCKESGGGTGTAKLTAARNLSLPVVIIKQPKIQYPEGVRFFGNVGNLKI